MMKTALCVLMILTGTAVWAQEWSAATPAEQRADLEKARRKATDDAEAKVAIVEPKLVSTLEMKTTTGAPYSAEATTEFVQTLADGNRIVRRTTARIFRDSDGRVRRESIGADGVVESVSIVDPVSGTSVTLEPSTRTFENGAQKFSAVVTGGRGFTVTTDSQFKRQLELRKQMESLARKMKEAGKDASSGQTVRHEDLGQRSIEGVPARGMRTTTTIPAGAIGNEQPINVISEEWLSSDLQVLVLTRHSDPRSGETVYSLSNIYRGEPDRSLFEVPADYMKRSRR